MDLEGDLGLNIVAVPAQKPVASPKKKVKRNKFEKRRQKAARQRELKAEQKRSEQESWKERDLKDEKTKHEHAEDEQGKPGEVAAIPVPPRETVQDAYPEDFAERDKDSSVVRSTAHLPQNEEERAAYLAEFHARPLELDRRAGALRKLATSKDSQHLFSQVRTWSDCGLPDRLIHALQSNHFDLAKPTIVQTKAIPAFSKNDAVHNILLHSETGSGKTLAYLLPILQSLAIDRSTGGTRRMDRSKFGTRCLILCPTRELASQTFQVVERLCTNSFNWIVPGSLLGEENRKSEKARLRKGLAIIVATPGRFLDHLQKTESLLMALKGKLEWLVLDEADRLLDMGLGGQVKQIVQHIRSNQPASGPYRNGITWRSALVSATVTSTIEELAKETMVGKDETWEWVRGDDRSEKDSADADRELSSSTPRQLAQVHMTVSAKFRLAALIALLVKRIEKGERAVVFFSTCASVDYHHALFTAMDSILDQTTEKPEQGIFGSRGRILKLHGSVSHTERQQTIRQFLKPHCKEDSKSQTSDSVNSSEGSKNQRGAVLLATDVAARGLNLQNCDWTIQYDPPSEMSDYVHRAGRVARAGKAGHSLLFLLPSERPYLEMLQQRGITKLTAISLASTLDAAAKVCAGLTKEGIRHAGGGLGQDKQQHKGNTRAGEAFGAEVQRRCEACLQRNDEEIRTAQRNQRKAERKADGGDGNSKSPLSRASHTIGLNLMELARRAFLAHVRAYPTREKSVKHIFSARALHLGHVAKSFALREAPKRSASKAAVTGKSGATLEDDSKKRSAALAFAPTNDDGETEGSRQAQKRQGVSPPRMAKGSYHIDTKKNRAVMIANATKLNGLDSL